MSCATATSSGRTSNTGLILKARMVNERNEAIEQFAFSQLQINRCHRPG
jgi:negative regulator of sigma E activity